jgi:hypothetical protein
MNRPMHYILTADGEPAICDSWLVWAIWFESSGEERRIAWDDLGGGVSVSTVFLGLDHGFLDTRPLLFETMVFGDTYNDELRRYSTRAEALFGHARIVRDVRGAMASKAN